MDSQQSLLHPEIGPGDHSKGFERLHVEIRFRVFDGKRIRIQKEKFLKAWEQYGKDLELIMSNVDVQDISQDDASRIQPW